MVQRRVALSSARARARALAEEDAVMAVSIKTKKWTLAELHRLPDDGNKYELVRGELFVTPPASDEHETIAAMLGEILVPYVRAHRLGHVYRPRAVLRYSGSEVEPDLMVRRAHPDRRGDDSDWTRAPTPILVVEILSEFTRRRDREDKRSLYLDAGVEQYWIVDPEDRCITVVRLDAPDVVSTDDVTWHPTGASQPLSFGVGAIFDL
jgi:Uma2 family endonuclease